MGLLQQAVRTYDIMEKIGLVGKYEEGKKEPLAPVGHIIANAKIEITIDRDGNFVSAQKVDKKIIIPVTEESSGRTSAPAPHLICDKLDYLSGENEEKYKRFIEQLEFFESSEYSDKITSAVLKYLKKNHVINDLLLHGLIEINGNSVKNRDDLICWRVIGFKDESGYVFEGPILRKFEKYYCDRLANTAKDICFVTGEKEVSASQHMGGVAPLHGKAKIISTKDDGKFTYWGRFCEGKEALTVGHITSQKAHNALKWLVANQGFRIDSRYYICWNPQGKRIPGIQSPLLPNKEDKIIPKDYKKALQEVLLGYRKELNDQEDVIIASFDAATTGRLSVGYYGELKGSDFLERLEYWDMTCCWFDNRYGTSSPSLMSITRFAFGNQRGNDEAAKIEVDDRIQNQQMYRLIKCRIEKARIPTDIVRAVVGRAGNLQIYNKGNRQKLLFTACAIINKYMFDYGREAYEMSLETTKKDRSYQYGRLLAVLEKIEKDTYDREENRETNAIRMQSVFVKRPAYATRIILEQLKNGYYPKLSSGTRVYYDKLIGQIMEVISEFEEDYNKSLAETYLLGYYLQKNDLYTKKTENEQED